MSVFHHRKPVAKVSGDVLVKQLSSDFSVSESRVTTLLQGAGIKVGEGILLEDLPLCREILSCSLLKFDLYKKDGTFTDTLDAQLKDFDEIYVDTAPLIHKDWFFYFLANVMPMLRRRRMRLVILEKTMEELHGLKNNNEKDREVQIRAMILPSLIKNLARKGFIRIRDTGSIGIADDHLISLFRKRGVNFNILLITQDRGLSERVVRLDDELSRGFQIPHRSLWYRLTHSGEDLDFIKKRLEVCKLEDDGSLKRLYICPSCQESYYDEMSDYPGYVPCSRCVLTHMELKKQQHEEAKKAQEIEAERNRVRQQEIDRIEAEKEKLRHTMTVGKKITYRKRRRIAACIAFALLVLLAFLLAQ